MKNKTLVAAAIASVAGSALAQTVRPYPASSITNHRFTSVYVAPAPDLSGYAPIDGVGRGTRAWTSYFAGQQKFSMQGRAVIESDGSVSFWSNNGGGALVAQVVGNAQAFQSLSANLCNDGPSLIASFVAVPVFTQAAALNGLPPYDWIFQSSAPPAQSCL